MKYFLCLAYFFLIPEFLAQPIEELRGVKLTETDSYVLFTDENIAAAMDYLSSVGINAVLPVVLNGGYTQYPSQVMDSLFSKPIDPKFAGRDPLERVVIEAHRNGIEVYPWFEYGFAAYYSGGTPPFGGHILQSYPHWACKTPAGDICTKNGFDWMSGIRPEVQEFIRALVEEVIENYDVDGIEFSDRIPAMPVEGGYEDYTVNLYKSEHGGTAPPANYRNQYWMRWRADKLTGFYQSVRDLVKSLDTNLFVASSPSIYPWAYEEYLQDPPAWVNNGIADHFIPQLYRYNTVEYIYELNKAIIQINPDKRDRLFAGILMNVGGYTVEPDTLFAFMQANRDRGLSGEAFFFYEGLRKNNDQLGDTLGSTFYASPAIIPLRNGTVRRPKATIVNEDDDGVILTGNWQQFPIQGYQPNVYITSDPDYCSIEYFVDVPFDAWFDVYAYIVPNTVNTTAAPYTVYSGNDTTLIYIDQKQIKNRGWRKLATSYLSAGFGNVVKLDNIGIGSGEYIVADAVMLTINRKLSPDIIVGMREDLNIESTFGDDYNLRQNFPNPFNSSTRIIFTVPPAGNRAPAFPTDIELKVYDIMGKEVATLVDGQVSPGTHGITWHAGNLASGVYFVRLRYGGLAETKKMLILK